MNPDSNNKISFLLILTTTVCVVFLPLTASANNTASPSILAIVSRWHEQIRWLENKHGSPIIPTRSIKKLLLLQ